MSPARSAGRAGPADRGREPAPWAGKPAQGGSCNGGFRTVRTCVRHDLTRIAADPLRAGHQDRQSKHRAGRRARAAETDPAPRRARARNQRARPVPRRRTAARFGARLVRERRLSVVEAQLAFAAPQTLPSPDRDSGGEALCALLEHHRETEAAEHLQQWLQRPPAPYTSTLGM